MEYELAETLCDICNNEGIECEVREGYSGRFMYGSETTGIILNSEMDLIKAIINNADMLIDENDGAAPLFNIGRLKSDSMGRQTIVY